MPPLSAKRSAPDPGVLRLPAWAAIVALTLLVAALAAIASGGEAASWYRSLDKPPGSPAPLAFSIVQPMLYFLMAIGAGLAAKAAGGWREADEAIGVYFVQLIASLGWNVMFFHLHAPFAALFDVLAQWMLMVAVIAGFARHSELAAQLQVPCLLWLTFTAYINAGVVFAS